MTTLRPWAIGYRLLAVGCGLSAVGCSTPDPSVVQLPTGPSAQAGKKEEPPVAVNPDIPVEYPTALYQQGIEGRVLLKLWVDSTGTLDGDSTKVAESSGYPAFDSSAVAA
ncbi:MAG TPA: energy transducer TonB, partial [Gemmatimonadales bacterium]|nr:energy transducer TonB [Gemmatimonadales bacterium]